MKKYEMKLSLEKNKKELKEISGNVLYKIVLNFLPPIFNPRKIQDLGAYIADQITDAFATKYGDGEYIDDKLVDKIDEYLFKGMSDNWYHPLRY